MRTEKYTGTEESAKALANNLHLKKRYSFNQKDKTLTDHINGVIYMPGDYYQYAIHEKFKVF